MRVDVRTNYICVYMCILIVYVLYMPINIHIYNTTLIRLTIYLLLYI